MESTISGLTTADAEFLAGLAARGETVFRIEDVAPHWRSRATARRALSRLEHRGWLQRIERGLYMLVPLEAGLDRRWSADTLVIASRLAPAAAAAYWTALRFWNFTEQVPHTVFVQTPQRKFRAELVVGGVEYRVVHIATARFFGLAERGQETLRFQVTDREKTIVDAADRPDLSGGAWQLARALQQHWAELDWVRVDAYLDRFGSGALYKRLGYLVDVLDLAIPDRINHLAVWQQRLTSGITILDPSAEAAGPVVSRWRIRNNMYLFAFPGGKP